MASVIRAHEDANVTRMEVVLTVVGTLVVLDKNDVDVGVVDGVVMDDVVVRDLVSHQTICNRFF